MCYKTGQIYLLLTEKPPDYRLKISPTKRKK
jgi:hypothetical protein